MDGVLDPPLNVLDDVSGLPLIPAAVEVLGDAAQLHDQVFGEILRLEFAALLPPQPHELRLIMAHDDAGIGAADESAAVVSIEFDNFKL